MSGYINTYGTTVGPIQLGPSGSWIIETFHNIGEGAATRHITFSYQKQGTDTSLLALMRGKTPLIGGEYDKEGRYIPYCDPHTLVTAEWVAGFASLKPGEQLLDLSQFVTVNEFNSLRIDVTNNKNNIANTQRDLDILEKTFEDYQSNPFSNGVIFRCGGANINEVIN